MKLTESKSTEPSATENTGFSGLRSAGSSPSTSPIRLKDSEDIVRITYIIESIISDMSICTP